MKDHYSEADLLEAQYLQLGERTPIMQHLFDCDDCAAKYQNLQRKLREAAACSHEKSETFWTWQKHSIVRKIGRNGHGHVSMKRTLGIAATAAFSFVLGGAIVYRSIQPATPQAAPAPARTATSAAVTKPQTQDNDAVWNDPWQSDELKEFHGVVQWESWVESTPDGEKKL